MPEGSGGILACQLQRLVGLVATKIFIQDHAYLEQQMFKVHGYLNGKKVIDWRMEHLPRTGDTVRFTGEKYAKVTEIIWCMDEQSSEGQRVNVRMENLGQDN